MIRVFIDTEFTGLTKDADLISIGCVDSLGGSFYGEILDFDRSKCDTWIKINIFTNLISKGKENFKPHNEFNIVIDTKDNIRKEFTKYLNHLSRFGEIQFVSDCLSYDQVLVNDLLTNGEAAIKLSSYFHALSPAWEDINYLIAENKKISMWDAFNTTREDLVKKEIKESIDSENKHNSLYDAKVIKLIYDKFKK